MPRIFKEEIPAVAARTEVKLRCPMPRFVGTYSEMGHPAEFYDKLDITIEVCKACKHHLGVVEGQVDCDYTRSRLRESIKFSCNPSGLSMFGSTGADIEPCAVPAGLETMDEEALRKTYDDLETNIHSRPHIERPNVLTYKWRPSDNIPRDDK